MKVTIHGKYVGILEKEYNGKIYCDVAILQEGSLGTERISITPEMKAAIEGIDEMTPLTIEASAWSHSKGDRSWINWRAERMSIG